MRRNQTVRSLVVFLGVMLFFCLGAFNKAYAKDTSGFKAYFIQTLLDDSGAGISYSIEVDNPSGSGAKRADHHKELLMTGADTQKYYIDKGLLNSNLKFDLSGNSDSKVTASIRKSLLNGGGTKNTYYLTNATPSKYKVKDKNGKTWRDADYKTRLLLSLPGWAGSDKTYQKKARDTTVNSLTPEMYRDAQKISEEAKDFNKAIGLNARAKYGDKVKDLKDYQIAQLIQDTANLKFYGKLKASKLKAGSEGKQTLTLTGYVKGSPVKEKLVYRRLKGTIKYANQHGGVIDDKDSSKTIPDTDTKYINWRAFALNALSAYSMGSTMSAESDTATAHNKFVDTINNWLGDFVLKISSSMNGLYAPIQDLIYNQGVRGSDSWTAGIIPTAAIPILKTLVYITNSIGSLLVIVGAARQIFKRSVDSIRDESLEITPTDLGYDTISSLIIMATNMFFIQYILEFNSSLVSYAWNLGQDYGVTDQFNSSYSGFVSGLAGIVIGLIMLWLSLDFSIYYLERTLLFVNDVVFLPLAIGMDSVTDNSNTKRYLEVWFGMLQIIFIQAIQAWVMTGAFALLGTAIN
ncbi:hypothetical protein EFL77_09005 [Pediococcus pentosaceus]|uniref:hypothetical protein n=1 Tax=Pediococcus pentosaceus TaxID=1255 RepID=UPI00223BDEDC|nr:hypothetical protein [Pediococcus pentosaceus]MCT1178634.1 hypothetical protein [Pediococcus pentosaceus]